MIPLNLDRPFGSGLKYPREAVCFVASRFLAKAERPVLSTSDLDELFLSSRLQPVQLFRALHDRQQRGPIKPGLEDRPQFRDLLHEAACLRGVAWQGDPKKEMSAPGP